MLSIQVSHKLGHIILFTQSTNWVHAIAQIVAWEKPNPNHKGIFTDTLDKHFPHFSDDENHHKGESLVTLEGLRWKVKRYERCPYRSRLNVEMKLGKESCEKGNGCQE
jgi:hypothetical protein